MVKLVWVVFFLSFFPSSKSFDLRGKNNIIYQVPSISEPIALGIFTFGYYEHETISTILRHLPNNGIFVDIGANIGSISLPIAKIKSNSKVIAIEASINIYKLLEINIIKNNIKNVKLINSFVGDNDRVAVPFFEAPDQKFGMGSIGAQFGNSPIYLLQRSLDSIFDELEISSPSVIKLDIEGAELLALRGTKNSL